MNPGLKYLLLLFSALPLFLVAQKLPKIQTAAVRAPQNIKIDGKLTEWNDQFQAYNTGNHIYYTLSNDDNNLYLTVQTEDIIGSRKIFRGGLTFTIIPSKKNADKLSVTFPFIAYNRPNFLGDAADGGPLVRNAGLTSKKVAINRKIDSVLSVINNAIKNYKEIHVKGLPGISDPLLSIYNTQDIIVGASFDKNMRYTYELAIPLKYLEAAVSDVKSLKYNIQLRAYVTAEGKRPIVQSSAPIGPELKVAERLRPPDADDLFLDNDTDFSGEYTLAK